MILQFWFQRNIVCVVFVWRLRFYNKLVWKMCSIFDQFLRPSDSQSLMLRLVLFGEYGSFQQHLRHYVLSHYLGSERQSRVFKKSLSSYKHKFPYFVKIVLHCMSCFIAFLEIQSEQQHINLVIDNLSNSDQNICEEVCIIQKTSKSLVINCNFSFRQFKFVGIYVS